MRLGNSEFIVQHNQLQGYPQITCSISGPPVPCSLVSRVHHEEDDLVNQVEFFEPVSGHNTV